MSSNSSNTAPSTQWFAGMTDAERKEFTKILEQHKNNVVLLRLVELVINQITELNIQSDEGYASPNWPYSQADINGQKRGLRFVKDLLRFTNADQVKERM